MVLYNELRVSTEEYLSKMIKRNALAATLGMVTGADPIKVAQVRTPIGRTPAPPVNTMASPRGTLNRASPSKLPNRRPTQPQIKQNVNNNVRKFKYNPAVAVKPSYDPTPRDQLPVIPDVPPAAYPKDGPVNPAAPGRFISGVRDPKIRNALEEYYHGVQRAEMQGEKDPWIRTRHRPAAGSAAYGPYQATPTKMNDYMDRFGKHFTPDEHYWHQNYFAPQAEQFLKYGNEPHLPGYKQMWEYGGKGFLGDTLESRRHYLGVTRKMMEIDLALSGGDYYKALNMWKGDTKPLDRNGSYWKKFVAGTGDYRARNKRPVALASGR